MFFMCLHHQQHCSALLVHLLRCTCKISSRVDPRRESVGQRAVLVPTAKLIPKRLFQSTSWLFQRTQCGRAPKFPGLRASVEGDFQREQSFPAPFLL